MFLFFLFFTQTFADSCFRNVSSAFPIQLTQLRTKYPIVTLAKDIVHKEDVQYLLNVSTSFVRSGLLTSEPTEARNSQTAFTQKNKDPILDCIGARIATVIHQPFENMECFQLTKYTKDQHYRPHFDWFKEEHNQKGQRTFTVFVYLKTARCGGWTIFPKLGINTSAPPGSGLIWSNVDNNGKGEKLVLHGGEDVTCNDTKIGLNVWFRNRPYKHHCAQHYEL